MFFACCSDMRILIGLIWALGGAILGFVAGALASMAIVTLTNASNREGAHGYLMLACGVIGAFVGVVVGLFLYGRSAPTGASFAYFGSGALGLAGAVAAAGLALWAFLYLQERPVKYEDEAMADLMMELRIETVALPPTPAANWLNVEVQTAKTRPEGLVQWNDRRTEGTHTIIPVTQGPLYRAGSRVIVVRVASTQDEAFMPPMKRVPDPKADWSEWYRPTAVDPPYGVVPPAPLKPLFELRYRVRRYGD